MNFPTRPLRALRLCLLLFGLLCAGLAQAESIVKPWPPKKAAPAFRLTDLQGRAWTLHELRGKVVVLNFWASWCEPCVAEMPSLLRLAERHAEDGLVVLAPNYQEGEAKIRGFLELVLGEVPQQLPVLLDTQGEAARAWTPRVFPSTVLIDRNGSPRWTVVGQMDWGGAQAEHLLGPLLGPKGAAK